MGSRWREADGGKDWQGRMAGFFGGKQMAGIFLAGSRWREGFLAGSEWREGIFRGKQMAKIIWREAYGGKFGGGKPMAGRF